MNSEKHQKGKVKGTGKETELKRKEKKVTSTDRCKFVSVLEFLSYYLNLWTNSLNSEQMDVWELHEQVAASQENIKWLEVELKRERKRNRRLQAALTAASEKAKNNK